jgi:hypothetical protein
VSFVIWIVIVGVTIVVFALAMNSWCSPEQSYTPQASTPMATTHPYKSFDESKISTFNEFPGQFGWDIVGESKYQAALKELCGGTCEDGYDLEVWALLVPETGNPHDENAVAVHMDTGLVGYLDRNNARRFRFAIGKQGLGGYAFKVPAKVVGGWDRGNGDVGFFGVKLDLPGSPLD